MTKEDRYLKIVFWSEEDQCYVGICPDLMLGGVHGTDEIEVYRELCDAVSEWIQIQHDDEQPLPPATNRHDLAIRLASTSSAAQDQTTIPGA